MDVQINNVSTQIGVVDRSVLLSPEVMALIVAAVIAQLEDHQRIASERERDTRVQHLER